MTNKIEIKSFQGGLANDRNIGQAGSFWNSKSVNYRENSSYCELAKGESAGFTLDYISLGTSQPSCMTFWGNGGLGPVSDIVVFSGQKIIVGSGGSGIVTHTSSSASYVNTVEANGKRYIISQSSLKEFVSTTSVTDLVTFGNSTTTRPAINFYGDIIIGSGKSVLRYNKDGTLVEYSSTLENPVIGGLEGDVKAITQIGPNVYVWTTDGTNTILYIWDGLTSRPSQSIKYTDVAVRNVAVVGNKHYWWTTKGQASQGEYSVREVFIGDSYEPSTIAKSTFPDSPLSTQLDADNNRLALTQQPYSYISDIETINGFVLLPGVGSIYTLGKQFPESPYSICREFSYPFSGSDYSLLCMSAGGTSSSGDIGGLFAFIYTSGSNQARVSLINLGQKGLGVSSPIKYQSSGFLETMEYLAPQISSGENNSKICVPFNLPHSSTSIEVYGKMNRGTYALLKTIDTTTYGTGYNVAEIAYTGNWKLLQYKFNLITSNTTYSPQLYTGITNFSTTTGQK